ncbi:hypothetical protein JVT61DRAFT_2180 [Boletus reticuloceps]|uniref:DUF3074 domain-containing protein n=1 Tax=Boletus reticuloceps TaxID=495285 RepID=A0A8I3ABC5_9AGAM|nr:hypothetical protein JVT61DRAFT_2180 [Boletus reticuloceps]
MSYQLSITALKPQEVPSEDTIIALGKELIDSTATWKKGKTLAKGKVLTLSRPKGPGDGAPWHCRASEHTKEDATFDEFWGKLGVDKAENEKESVSSSAFIDGLTRITRFIEPIKKVARVKSISDTQSIWTLYYTFPPPVSPRVFTVLQTVHLVESSPKSGIIVSVPIDLSADEELAKIEEKGVKGRYVSVERLLELEDGKVEWRMATSSSPGGSIPLLCLRDEHAWPDSSRRHTFSQMVSRFARERT